MVGRLSSVLLIENLFVLRDKTFDDHRLVETDVEGNEMTYSVLKAPWPIARRDFLQWRRTVVQSDSVFIMSRSAEHREYPEVYGIVRAETVISGRVTEYS